MTPAETALHAPLITMVVDRTTIVSANQRACSALRVPSLDGTELSSVLDKMSLDCLAHVRRRSSGPLNVVLITAAGKQVAASGTFVRLSSDQVALWLYENPGGQACANTAPPYVLETGFMGVQARSEVTFLDDGTASVAIRITDATIVGQLRARLEGRSISAFNGPSHGTRRGHLASI